ncbi:uncharacterized protein TNCV_3834921 [Trichonephila clavipes]|nr:uncharacterized protein TNCV_3834921 [Trichonephila clavipes]
MVPGSRCMSGNTCGCRMSWTYRWAAMVPQINTRVYRVLFAMAPHTLTSVGGMVCHCKEKSGFRHSPLDFHTRTRLSSLLRLNLDSSLKTAWFHSTVVQFPRAWHYSKPRRRWVGVKGSTRNRHRVLKCPSARRLRMVREDTGTPNEGATCAFGCTRAFLTMWRSSRRLVCRGSPEPDLRVNNISRIH